jgi:hypothetical protein
MNQRVTWIGFSLSQRVEKLLRDLNGPYNATSYLPSVVKIVVGLTVFEQIRVETSHVTIGALFATFQIT